MLWTAFLIIAGGLHGEPPATPLWLRGHAVIPTPRKVTLGAGDVVFDESWSYRADGLAPSHIAIRSLTGDLRSFHQLSLGSTAKQKTVRLAVSKGATGLKAQGYALEVKQGAVSITGNSDAGLLYGVQTFLQLLKAGPRGTLLLPEVSIEDWPALELRFLHWDTKHHQDRMETLKRYLDWAVRFKVNRIGFELEDKFAYPSLPDIGAPGAFTAAELQEIVNYGLERFIQVVPVIQSPAHLSYVLKHPRYAHLKADGNNYQSDLCNEGTYKLLFQMYDDVIAATKGVDMLFVSTDEVYYAGIGSTCSKPYNEENRSIAWAEFARRAHDHLASRGRRMLAWIEYPLLPQHLKLIPPGVIDGVMGEEEYLPLQKAEGRRQLVYVSMQGAEFLFPDHLPLDANLGDTPSEGDDDPLEFERGVASGRIRSIYSQVPSARVWGANPIGLFGAAWGDSGLHNETFWLGWAAAARYGWHPGSPSPEQHTSEFMQVYYGPNATGMVEVYRMMQRQARAWQRTWDRVVSKVRGPGYGNSYGKGRGTTRYDQTLKMPPLPEAGTLALKPEFRTKYREYLRMAAARQLENDQLIHALQENIGRGPRNAYNLEVMLSLAHFVGHHWRLLYALADAERDLDRARTLSSKDPAQAVGYLVSAFNRIGRAEKEGLAAYAQVKAAFENSQFPKGRTVNGREFVQVLDDVKDHWGGRTTDLGYMYAAEKSMGMEQWRGSLRKLLEAFARQHNVPVKGLAEARLEE